MKGVTSFIIENSIDFKPIMSNLPVPLLKKLINKYKSEKTKSCFEDWIYDNTWMLVDSSYTKIKNYTIFLLDKTDQFSIFGNESEIGLEVNSEFVLNYFKPLFNNLFFKDDGSYNEKNLEEWTKSYNCLGRREFYKNLVEKRIDLDEPEFSQILLSLFIQSLGVTIQNYFELTDTAPPSLEDAEYMVAGFLDCSDPNISLSCKWKYLEQHGRFLNAEIYKRTLYQMLRTNLSEQRRTIQLLCSVKNKKLKLSNIQEKLSKENQHLFCSCWQRVTGI